MYPDNSITNDGNLVQHLALMANSEPVSLDEAISSEVWRIAMEDEIKSIEKKSDLGDGKSAKRQGTH